MQVSVREVFDLADRCFYAAGFAEGSARANAEAIWWTEVARGSGLTLLHGLVDELPSLDRTRLQRRETGSAAPVIDGDGQPSVVSSTPALDLGCARADRRGIGVAYATVAPQDGTVSSLGHVAYKAAERGLLAVVLYATDGGASATVVGVPRQPYPLVAEYALDAPSEGYTKLWAAADAGLDGQHGDLPTRALFRGEGPERSTTAEGRLVRRLLDGATMPADGGDGRRAVPSGFVTVCIDPTHPAYPRRIEPTVARVAEARAGGKGEGESDDVTVFRPERIRQRAERLLREGVDVDRDIWLDIFEYSSNVLAPEFEGSYRGAGFEINE